MQVIEEYTLREELKKIDAVRKEQKRHLPASIESELVNDRLAALKKKQGSRSARPVAVAVETDTVWINLCKIVLYLLQLTKR